jgi:putative ABC transport system ATP-binding protein
MQLRIQKIYTTLFILIFSFWRVFSTVLCPFPDTAYENIELPLLAANVKRKDRKRIILKQMEHLGILSERNKLPGKMSGGQQQRVAIARALVTNADIILADEPTGALDQKTGREVLELLKEINKSGKTVIIVTHDEGIAKMTDRIITISDGKIVGDN